MQAIKPSLSWLSDPQVYAVNRIEAHSDHWYYETEEQLALEEDLPLRQSLNGTWQFAYSPNPGERPEQFYREDYDLSGFAPIAVPGHIQLQGYDRCHYINTMYPWDGEEYLRPPHISEVYNPVGSYVKYVTVSDEWKGKPVFISFQGVETACYVWLNGAFVGYSEDSFTPAEFELTPYLKPGENKLAVEVYKRSSASWLEDQDFWRFSGIFRDVYLYTVPDSHVQDLFVKAGLDDTYTQGELWVNARVTGAPFDTAVLKLTDVEGRLVYEAHKKAGRDLTWSAVIPEVSCWSAENPQLYNLFIHLLDEDGRIIEVVKERAGFRCFELVSGIMKLNGQRLIFRGVNRHEFQMQKGRCIGAEEMLWDIRFMKQHNINAVRTSHYPNQTLWYRLCDEYGIYLIDEANLESHGSWQKLGECEPSWNVPGSLAEWEGCTVDRAKSMLERDKNHPSILIWSCGNESYAGTCIEKMADYFRSRDDSRLVHYEGVFWNREFDEISDMESRMYAKPAEIETYLRGNPKKPYISCEYMHAMGNSCGGMSLYTDLEDAYRQYQGGFIWDYIDQSILWQNEQGELRLTYGGDFDDRATDYEFCGNGIVFADRTVTPKAQEVKGLYAAIRLNVSEKGVAIENRNCFIGTDQYEFTYRLLRDGECLFERAVNADVPPLGTAFIELDFPATEVAGEYLYEVSVRLKADTLWADAGYEISSGQMIKQVSAELKEKQTKATEADDGVLEVIHGDVNLGVRGDGFHVMFSAAEGGIASLRYEGEEFITRAFKPTYFRALTDNDRGNQMGFECGAWLQAGLYSRMIDFQVKEELHRVQVRFTYQLPTQPETKSIVTYTVFTDGRIEVTAEYKGVRGLPRLPLFGMDIKFKSKYDRYQYYGYGPEENYIDRMQGARLGCYESTAKANLTPYLVPQECGNRVGTRWLQVMDENGRGLCFTCVDEPFESSVLPYSAYELEQAEHQEELPGIHYTWVRILAAQMGVGGDDSWGAPVQEQYLLSSETDRKLVFTIQKL